MSCANNFYEGEGLLKQKFNKLLAGTVETPTAKGRVILEVMHADDAQLSLKEMLRLVGLRHRGSFIERHLQPLIKSGLVTMENTKARTSPKQRYRLSAKGLVYMVKANNKKEENLI